MPQFAHGWMVATGCVGATGRTISRLEAAHMASVDDRDINVARASTWGCSADAD